jgi:hypothetical protein
MVQGSLVGGDEQPLRFTFADRPLWKKIFGMGNRSVITLVCVHCGNLQQQVQFTDVDRERFVSYDGPQASIVEDNPDAGD